MTFLFVSQTVFLPYNTWKCKLVYLKKRAILWVHYVLSAYIWERPYTVPPFLGSQCTLTITSPKAL